MKNPTAIIDVEQRGTLKTDTAQALGIDLSGMDVVLSMLSNMYSNGSLAVVREYACNARDSHVEAGNTEPILVSLPTPLDPQLRVQDFGLGLSKTEILKVYSQYGASTKRDSNEQIGAFGIGSKSAFTVGDQFVVTGVKFGRKTVALFARNGTGAPTVQILQETETDEPNGVLVEVSVDDVNAVCDAAKSLFPTWERGSVLVNGKAPAYVWNTAQRLSDNVALDISGELDNVWDTHVVVHMGGVPYKVPSSLYYRLDPEARRVLMGVHRDRAFVFVKMPIGAVDITPSREELRVTDRTVAALNASLSEFHSAVVPWLTERVQQAPSLFEASRLYAKIVTNLFLPDETVKQLVWRGQGFGSRVVDLRASGHSHFTMRDNRSRYGEKVCRKVDATFDISFNFANMLVITETPIGKDSFVQRYGKTWMENDPHTSSLLVSPESKLTSGWLSFGTKGSESLRTMTFEKFREKVLEMRREARGPIALPPRGKTLYDTNQTVNGTSALTIDEIVQIGNPVIIMNNKHGHLGDLGEMALNGKTAVYLTGVKKIETLQKRLEKKGIASSDLYDAIREVATEILDNLTKDDRALISANGYVAAVGNTGIDWIKQNRSKVTNKALLAYLAKWEESYNLSKDHQGANRINLLQNAAARSGRQLPGTGRYQTHPNRDLISRDFPLLYATLNWTFRDSQLKNSPTTNDHLVHYVNSVSS